MIGSCTLIVKENDSYRVHIIGGVVLGDIKVKELTAVDKKYKNKPDASNLSAEDVYKILSSHQCNSEHEPHYSKFAGDRRWFLDLSTNSLIDVDGFIKKWEETHKNQIDKENFQREKIKNEKIKTLLKTLNKDAKIFCEELLKVIEEKSTLPYSPQSFAKDSRDYDKIDFRIGDFSFSKSRHSNNIMFFAPRYNRELELISDKFNFQKLFFKFLKKNWWTITTIQNTENYSSGKRTRISAFLAKQGERTIFWNIHMKNDLYLVEMETV
jgi:hypothetical protein